MATTKRASRTAKKTAGAAKKTTSSAKKAAPRAAKKAASGAKKAATPKKAAASAKKAASGAKKAASAKRAGAGAKKVSGTKRASTTKRAASPRRTGEPDAIDLLIADHREVEQVFARFEKTGSGADKQREELVQRMTVALSQHAAIEEDVFYPAARREVPDTNDDVLEALEEHHVVKVTLAELQAMDPRNERYRAKVSVLIESVRHHVEEEEGELFPRLRRTLGAARLRELRSELAAAKQSAPTRPHPEAPDTPPGSVVAQAISAPFDAAANLTGTAARRVRDIVT